MRFENHGLNENSCMKAFQITPIKWHFLWKCLRALFWVLTLRFFSRYSWPVVRCICQCIILYRYIFWLSISFWQPYFARFFIVGNIFSANERWVPESSNLVRLYGKEINERYIFRLIVFTNQLVTSKSTWTGPNLFLVCWYMIRMKVEVFTNLLQ